MPKAHLKVRPDEYWKQKRKECGAYVMKAVLNMFEKDGKGSPKDYLSSLSNLCYGFTWPRRILKVLRGYGLDAEVKRATRYPRKKRLDVLKYHLRQQEPVILLIGNSFNKKHKYRHFRRWVGLHWVLLMGYDDEKQLVYLYNPNVYVEHHEKGLPVGNVSLSYRQFKRQWRGVFLTSLVNYLYIPVRDPTRVL